MEAENQPSLFGKKKPLKRKAETGDGTDPTVEVKAAKKEEAPKIERERGGLGPKDFADEEEDGAGPSTSGQATSFDALGLSEWLVKVCK